MNRTKLDVERTYVTDEVIVEEGSPGNEMFIIQSGSVEVVRSGHGEPMRVATLGRGDFFGEMSLLESLPRTATVRAITPTKLLVLKRGGLLLMIRRDPTFALEMLQHMSRRLRFISQKLTGFLSSEGEITSDDLMSLVDTATLEVFDSEPAD